MNRGSYADCLAPRALRDGMAPGVDILLLLVTRRCEKSYILNRKPLKTFHNFY